MKTVLLILALALSLLLFVDRYGDKFDPRDAAVGLGMVNIATPHPYPTDTPVPTPTPLPPLPRREWFWRGYDFADAMTDKGLERCQSLRNIWLGSGGIVSAYYRGDYQGLKDRFVQVHEDNMFGGPEDGDGLAWVEDSWDLYAEKVLPPLVRRPTPQEWPEVDWVALGWGIRDAHDRFCLNGEKTTPVPDHTPTSQTPTSGGARLPPPPTPTAMLPIPRSPPTVTPGTPPLLTPTKPDGIINISGPPTPTMGDPPRSDATATPTRLPPTPTP